MQGFYTLIGCSFVTGGCLLAKTNATAILRTVVDPSGARVAGAKVTRLNLGTAIKCQDTSSAGGDYKNQLRQNQYGGVFSGPRRCCTRLIEFYKGVL